MQGLSWRKTQPETEPEQAGLEFIMQQKKRITLARCYATVWRVSVGVELACLLCLLVGFFFCVLRGGFFELRDMQLLTKTGPLPWLAFFSFQFRRLFFFGSRDKQDQQR